MDDVTSSSSSSSSSNNNNSNNNNSSRLRALHDLNNYFDSVVDMIPSAFYITDFTPSEEQQKEEDVINAINNKYKKGQSKENKEAKKVRQSIHARRHFNAHETHNIRSQRTHTHKALEKIRKKDKYTKDHEQDSKTTVVKKRKWDEVRKEAAAVANGGDDGDDSDNDTDFSGSDDGGEDEDLTSSASSSASSSAAPPAFAPRPGESRIDALRRKLSMKIEAARAGRPAQGDKASVSKRAARREKKERSKSAGAKDGFSKAERGVKRSLSAADAGSDAFQGGGPASSSSGVAEPKDDLAGLDFGTISGLKSTPAHAANKSLNNLGKKKSLDRLLAEATSKKAKLAALKASGSASDREKHDGIVWGDALKAADGAAVRSDPSAIKKAMKRKSAAKAKSAKKWADRITTVAASMMEKQKIRKHNLAQRKVGGAVGANLSGKRIVEEKGEERRGRKGPHAANGQQGGRAGFEGKRTSELNGKGRGGE